MFLQKEKSRFGDVKEIEKRIQKNIAKVITNVSVDHLRLHIDKTIFTAKLFDKSSVIF